MPKFQENIALSNHSHYKIGGPAAFFFDAKNEKDLAWAIKEAKARKLPVFVLGGGTNLLIGDEGFRGLVVKPNIQALRISKKTKSGDVAVTVGAGVMMADLLKFSIKKSLSGLEWAGGLPGTLGGAVRGNAGCFGGEIKDSIQEVKSFDTKTMKIITRNAAACGFNYRESVFKKKNGAEIILGATLILTKGNDKEIAKSIREKIDHRKKNHPLEYPNVGSMFKNVSLHDIHKKGSPEYKKALAAATLNFKGSTFSVKSDPFPVISTAKLIGEAGLKGVSFGGAMISPKHPNFIVNVLNAEAEHVKGLITLAKAEVNKKFGVQLEEEVQII